MRPLFNVSSYSQHLRATRILEEARARNCDDDHRLVYLVSRKTHQIHKYYRYFSDYEPYLPRLKEAVDEGWHKDLLVQRLDYWLQTVHASKAFPAIVESVIREREDLAREHDLSPVTFDASALNFLRHMRPFDVMNALAQVDPHMLNPCFAINAMLEPHLHVRLSELPALRPPAEAIKQMCLTHATKQRAAAIRNNGDLAWLYTQLGPRELRQLLADRGIAVQKPRTAMHLHWSDPSTARCYRELLEQNDAAWAQLAPIRSPRTSKGTESDIGVKQYCAESYFASFLLPERAFLGLHPMKLSTEKLRNLVTVLIGDGAEPDHASLGSDDRAIQHACRLKLSALSHHRRRARELSLNTRRQLSHEEGSDDIGVGDDKLCQWCGQYHWKASWWECTLQCLRCSKDTWMRYMFFRCFFSKPQHLVSPVLV